MDITWFIPEIMQNYERRRNILSDYHMHSTFGPDSSDSLDQMCRHALRNGFKQIAFTEHQEWHPEWKGTLNIPAYFEAIHEIKERYASQGLMVYSGVEIGNPHDHPDDVSAFLIGNQFDVVIASLHWLRGNNIHLERCFIGRNPMDVYT